MRSLIALRQKIKADIYMDSAIVNDQAYTIEPGFVGISDEPAQPQPAAPAKPAQPSAQAAAATAAKEAAAGEAAENDQLADYLLKIL